MSTELRVASAPAVSWFRSTPARVRWSSWIAAPALRVWLKRRVSGAIQLALYCSLSMARKKPLSPRESPGASRMRPLSVRRWRVGRKKSPGV